MKILNEEIEDTVTKAKENELNEMNVEHSAKLNRIKVRVNKEIIKKKRDLLESVLFDKRKSKTAERSDRLSKKRSLHLTIDGIHLNSKGAEIYEKHFSSILSRI